MECASAEPTSRQCAASSACGVAIGGLNSSGSPEAWLIGVLKSASEGNLLVAASYGYTFEWAHPASGHLSLGKLLRTREVDIIAGPPSYKDRDLGGTAAFPGPIDSFALNNKLFISEADFKTPISQASRES